MSNEDTIEELPVGGVSDLIVTANPALAFIKAYKVPILFILLALSFAGLYGFQYLDIKVKKIQIGNLKNKVEEQKIEIEHYKSESDRCKSNFDDLSSRIKKLSEDSKTIKDKVDSLAPVIKEISDNTDKDVKNIINSPIPKSCEEAMDYLKDYK